MPSQTDRPRYHFSADRTSARRRVRYVEGNHPNESGCGLCQLDELIQTKQPGSSNGATGCHSGGQ